MSEKKAKALRNEARRMKDKINKRHKDVTIEFIEKKIKEAYKDKK